jgi:hypothetical protein
VVWGLDKVFCWVFRGISEAKAATKGKNKRKEKGCRCKTTADPYGMTNKKDKQRLELARKRDTFPLMSR